MSNRKTKLPMILVIALPVLLLLSTALTECTFSLGEQTIHVSTFIFPLTYLVSYLISEKSESRYTLGLVLVSLALQCLVFVVLWVLFGQINYTLMLESLIAFFLSQFTFILICEMFKSGGLINFVSLFLTLILANLEESFTFYAFLQNGQFTSAVVNVNFIIKLVYALIIAYGLTSAKATNKTNTVANAEKK